jgi:hypothetical protein
LKKTNCRLNFGLKEWELEEWFLDWWNNGLLEEFDKVECWNDGKMEICDLEENPVRAETRFC